MHLVSKTGVGIDPITTGEKMESYTSVQSWMESLQDQSESQNKDFSETTWKKRLVLLKQYCGLMDKTPDELLQQDIKTNIKELKEYFRWLKKERRPKISHNTAITKLAYVRGFFTHNMIAFPKGFKLPRVEPTLVSERDRHLCPLAHFDVFVVS